MVNEPVGQIAEKLRARYGMDFDKLKEEKIDGRIYLMARPNRRHIRIQGNIARIFGNYFSQRGKKCEALIEDMLYLENGDYMEPDVMVFCYEDGRENKEEVPVIVIEVLSKSSRKRDLGVKMIKYAFLGIREYWVVDQYGSALDVYVLDNGRYRLEITCGVDTDSEEEPVKLFIDQLEEKDLVPEFVSEMFDGLTVKAEDVFYSVI